MNQWKNNFGVQIKKGCMSCKYSVDADPDGKRKLCYIDEDDANNKHERCFECSTWEPREPYKWIGSGRTASGAKAHPGDIKSPEYFRWLIKNASESWMPYSPTDKQDMFMRTYPKTRLILVKA